MVDGITGEHYDNGRSRPASPAGKRNDGELTQLLRRAMQPDGAGARTHNRHSTPHQRCSPEALAAALPPWKRALDLALVLITLPLWLPVMLLVAAWVAVTSPGPIFYRQPRVGFKCGRFMIVKFRTMKVNADTSTHEAYLEQLMASDKPMIKLDATGDPRLILGGKFLRATGLDELPQIFNVLRGEMSIVGPRPCTVREFELYSAEDRNRLDALPGLTGFWQVNGKNRTTFRQMVEMDVFYSKHLSLRLDLKIIARTFPAIAAQLVDLWQNLSARTAPPVSDNA
jgi:lipopolysaccharide/colanic/teichoic acid biosynthesis glycosyltransferase